MRCKLTKFVILDFSEIFYSKKPILKANILMTGIIPPTYIIPNWPHWEKLGRINHADWFPINYSILHYCVFNITGLNGGISLVGCMASVFWGLGYYLFLMLSLTCTQYFASQCILLYNRYKWWDLSSRLRGECVWGPASRLGVLPIPDALSYAYPAP